MNTALFNYILDTMTAAKMQQADNVNGQDLYDKLEKATQLFYDWYQTAWEQPQQAAKIKPENKE